MNILKLLKRRGVIDDTASDPLIPKKPTSIINTIIKFKGNKKVAINFVNNHISNVSKNSSVDDFLGQDINMIKILCVPSISKKFLNKLENINLKFLN